jgi:hypothetical protein
LIVKLLGKQKTDFLSKPEIYCKNSDLKKKIQKIGTIFSSTILKFETHISATDLNYFIKQQTCSGEQCFLKDVKSNKNKQARSSFLIRTSKNWLLKKSEMSIFPELNIFFL